MATNNDICMLLSSCDNYEDAWVPFFTQLKKNWPEFDMPVYLSTETKSFKFPGFEIINPLATSGKIYRRWSERLEKVLKKIDSEFVLFMLDDFWLTERVDDNELNHILEYMRQHENVGYVCLKNERKTWCKIPENERRRLLPDVDLFECMSNEPFRITTQAGIWRRVYLLKLLRSHESAWFFETRSNWRSKFYSYKVLDVKDTVLKYPVGGFFGGGQCYRDYVSLYPSELTAESINKRGLISFGDIRNYPSTGSKLKQYWSKFLSILPKW